MLDLNVIMEIVIYQYSVQLLMEELIVTLVYVVMYFVHKDNHVRLLTFVLF